ncbi:hypothetical protein ACOQFL_04360 [Actinopolyspora sp. H202]|uniref:hypothetical protein n=1 Tax=Actinopolyspora sp. H202 TaxID=1500456 RepID=UPI003EE58BF5
MSHPHTQLSVLLRRGEWMLSDAAFEIGGRRYTATQCRDTATVLDELAAALRQHATSLPSGELPTGELPGDSTPTDDANESDA